MKTVTGVRNNDLRSQPAYPLAEAARYLRLNFSNATPERIDAGIAILGRALADSAGAGPIPER